MGRTWLQSLAVILWLITATSATALLQSQTLYDWGLLGLWPRTSFQSFPLSAPRLNFLKWEQSCADGFYLIAPRGSYVQHQSPIILDGRGELVWTPTEHYGTGEVVTDFKVQSYRGQNVLTFWTGVEGEHHRYGMGSYYMVRMTCWPNSLVPSPKDSTRLTVSAAG